jgi:hypothetical protein
MTSVIDRAVLDPHSFAGLALLTSLVPGASLCSVLAVDRARERLRFSAFMHVRRRRSPAPRGVPVLVRDDKSREDVTSNECKLSAARPPFRSSGHQVQDGLHVDTAALPSGRAAPARTALPATGLHHSWAAGVEPRCWTPRGRGWRHGRRTRTAAPCAFKPSGVGFNRVAVADRATGAERRPFRTLCSTIAR